MGKGSIIRHYNEGIGSNVCHHKCVQKRLRLLVWPRLLPNHRFTLGAKSANRFLIVTSWVEHLPLRWLAMAFGAQTEACTSLCYAWDPGLDLQTLVL